MKGDGSVYETVDRQGRQRWVAQLAVAGRKTPVRRWLPAEIVETRGGKERRRAPTRTDALKKLRELRDAAARGEFAPDHVPVPEPEVQLPTLAEAVAVWLADGCPGGRRRKLPGAKTRSVYRSLHRCEIVPHAIGAVRLDALKRRDVRGFLVDRAEAGRSRSTLDKLQSSIVRAYRLAQERYEEQLGERANPAADVTMPPTKDARKRRALDVEEIRSLLAAVKGHSVLEVWARLGIDNGPRPSELSALCWQNVDLASEPATVTWCMSIAFEPDDDGHIVPRETEGKTGRPGWRKLTISPGTAAALKEHKRRQAQERLALPPGLWPDDDRGVALGDRVFRSPQGGLVDPSNLWQPLLRAADKAGIGHVTVYDLRHTAGTLIDERKGYEMAARALGHVPAGGGSVTSQYMHRRLIPVDVTCLDEALAEAVDRKAAGE